MPITELSRRTFLHSVAAATALSASAFAQEPSGKINQIDEVQLSQIHGPSEQNEKAPGPFLPMDQRIGFAIVGLGRLSLNQILPAFGHSQYCKPVALVSGDREKALKIAGQYGIASSAIYDYANFDQLAKKPECQSHLCSVAKRNARRICRTGSENGQTNSLREADGNEQPRG